MLSLIVLARPLDRDTDDVTLVKKKRTPYYYFNNLFSQARKNSKFLYFVGVLKVAFLKKAGFALKVFFSLEKELLCVNFA